MTVSYKKLFYLLIEKNICHALNCHVEDILEFTDEQ